MPCHEEPCIRCRRPARKCLDGVHVFDDGTRWIDGPLCRCCLDALIEWLEPCERAADPGCGKDCPIPPGNPDRVASCDRCPRKAEKCPTPGVREFVIPVRVDVPECEREKLKALRTLLGG